MVQVSDGSGWNNVVAMGPGKSGLDLRYRGKKLIRLCGWELGGTGWRKRGERVRGNWKPKIHLLILPCNVMVGG